MGQAASRMNPTSPVRTLTFRASPRYPSPLGQALQHNCPNASTTSWPRKIRPTQSFQTDSDPCRSTVARRIETRLPVQGGMSSRLLPLAHVPSRLGRLLHLPHVQSRAWPRARQPHPLLRSREFERRAPALGRRRPKLSFLRGRTRIPVSRGATSSSRPLHSLVGSSNTFFYLFVF
jgi:hypothetical protein